MLPLTENYRKTDFIRLAAVMLTGPLLFCVVCTTEFSFFPNVLMMVTSVQENCQPAVQHEFEK